MKKKRKIKYNFVLLEQPPLHSHFQFCVTFTFSHSFGTIAFLITLPVVGVLLFTVLFFCYQQYIYIHTQTQALRNSFSFVFFPVHNYVFVNDSFLCAFLQTFSNHKHNILMNDAHTQFINIFLAVCEYIIFFGMDGYIMRFFFVHRKKKVQGKKEY